MERWKRLFPVLWVMGCLALAWTQGVWAQPPADMGGWEKGGAYDRLYDPQERDKFKGTVEAVREVVPLPGMSPGVALVVRDRDGEEILVHLGPRWFIDPATMGIRVGDKVKVTGAWAEMGDEDVFIAAKVKKGEHFEFKVRLTKDGTPFWTLSPEELAKERAGQ
ncbi:MAG: hypothetical protein H5U10_00065 [Desulfacinum sp.]|nr:hypothetical protein [Desulfacinum sp.]